MKTAASRLRSATLLIEPLRATSRTVSASATASISTSGHNPLKARRVVNPPTHFQSGKMKLPKSKPRGSSTDSQSLSPLGKVLSKARLRRVSSRPVTSRDRGDQQTADYIVDYSSNCGDSLGLKPKAWHAEQGKAQQSENDDDRQKHSELLESIALHVATFFAGGRSGVVVAIRVGAPLAARPLVAGSALGAIHAAEARGHVPGNVACPDVRGPILTEHARHNARDQRRSEGPKFECGGQSPRGAIEMNAGEQWRECGSVVKRLYRAAAVVVVHGTIALGGETKRTRGANNRALGAVLSLLTRLATEAVRGVVARSTDHALAAAQEWLVRAGRAFKTPGPVGTTWPIGSLRAQDTLAVGSPRPSRAFSNHEG
eukprot:scaffold23068_cov70-Phaeocystis_antarctica.AAC.6